MLMTILIVVGGVKSGLERANKIISPVLVALVLLNKAGFF